MNEVHYAVTNLDTKAWPDELKKLYHNYVKNEANKAKKEPDNIEALEHQLKYMEKNLISLKEARSNAENRFRVDLRKRTHENSTLL